MSDLVIGEKIKSARKSKKISAAALGQMLDPSITPTAVYKWENGQTEPNINHLKQLSAILGLDLAEIFGDAEEKPHDEMRRYLDRMSEKQRNAVLGVARAMVDC